MMNLTVAEGELRYSSGQTLKRSCPDLSSQDRSTSLKIKVLSKHSHSAAIIQE